MIFIFNLSFELFRSIIFLKKKEDSTVIVCISNILLETLACTLSVLQLLFI